MKTAAALLTLAVAVHGFVPQTRLVVPTRAAGPAATTMVLGGFGRGRGLFSSASSGGGRRNPSGGKRGGFIGGGGVGGAGGANGGVPPRGGSGDVARGAGDGDSEKKGEEDSSLLARYDQACEDRPLLTKGLTSMVGFLLGDLMAQFFIEKTPEFDPIRTLRLASFGFLIHGTTSHYFYGWLDGKVPGTGAGDVAFKVAFDQILWNPIFGCMFFGYLGLTTPGEGIPGAVKKIKNDLWTSVRGSWTVWPAAHTINFRFISNNQRVLYINTIQIFYNCFLSIIGNKDEKGKK